jgi:NAD(P)-dependent dehydrogenase (short-subunit alcohol dehydrogenase family)
LRIARWLGRLPARLRYHYERSHVYEQAVEEEIAIMDGALNDRSVIITGAAGGIGRAAAVLFARAGARLTLADREAARGRETLDLVLGSGGVAQFLAGDISSERFVEDVVASAVRSYGRLDCAFNNAGIISDLAEPVSNYTLAEWDRVIRINLTSMFLCMKHETRTMLQNGGGAIVNTSSALGQVGQYNMPAYCASKAGVLGLTRATALDYATKNIRVNAIMPGVIETPMTKDGVFKIPGLEEILLAQHPIGRFGRPEEVASAALFLCSDAASFVTGHALAVDGANMAI